MGDIGKNSRVTVAGGKQARELEVLSRLLEAVPAFQLPLAVTEALHDVLIARERSLRSARHPAPPARPPQMRASNWARSK